MRISDWSSYVCSSDLQGALIVLIARDDPLDTYLVHHPAALLDKPIERVVIDPTNPYVLGPQLLCAATELALTDAEVRLLNAEAVADAPDDDDLLWRRDNETGRAWCGARVGE